MDLINYLKNNLITDNTKDLTSSKIFLKTAQNAKYAKGIKNYITPKELLNKLNLKTKFIGITGTNGKTTTAFVLSFLLRKLGFSVATQGTEGFFVNGEKKEEKTLTTPPILTTIKRVFNYKPDFFVMEVSSHAIAQNRIEGIDFFAKAFTSFSQDHLDFHKTLNEYKKVKESFLQDEAIKVVAGNRKEEYVEIGGVDFRFNKKNLFVIEKPVVEDIPMAGDFNKMNFSLALKMASLLSKKEIDELKKFIPLFGGVSGRMEIVSKEPLVIVDFAHTPDGMERVLSSIEGEKIVVFGAGGERDRDKRKKMGEVAGKLADYIILTEDNPRCEDKKEICKEISKGIKKAPFEIVLDRKEAIKKGLLLAKRKKASLFVLGKGDEEAIEYCKEKRKFKDKEVIQCLREELGI